MGMFDNISVADTLPYSEEMKELGLDINNYQFQTKDLDQCLANYFIQNNKLYIEKYKVSEWVEGDKDSKNLFDRIGRIKQEDPYLEEVSYHGDIYFYDFRNSVKDKWDCWIEFKAQFTNGVVEKYELVGFRKTDNAERLQREKEWNEKLLEQANNPFNKYFFHTRLIRWFANRVWYRGFYALGSFFHKVSHLSFSV